MATIIDIARAAGVSHGTVSNVLNGKGNVSTKKIKLVEEAANRMGYNLNSQAKALRGGTSNSVAIIIPFLKTREYCDFYESFHQYVTSQDYSVQLFLTNGFQETEKEVIKNVASSRVNGIALISNLENTEEYVKLSSFDPIEIVFVESKTKEDMGDFSFIGFDYKKAGEEIASFLLKQQYKKIGVINGISTNPNMIMFADALTNKLTSSTDKVPALHIVYSENNDVYENAFTLFQETLPYDVIVTTSSDKADIVQAVKTIVNKKTDIVTIDSTETLHDARYLRYELNYKLLGFKVGKFLIDRISSKKKEMDTTNSILPKEFILIEPDGFNFLHFPHITKTPDKKTREQEFINVLTLEAPSTNSLIKLSKQFTNRTGIDIRFAVYTYDELYSIVNEMEADHLFDVIRLDMSWLSWLSEKSLMPLTCFENEIKQIYSSYVDGIYQNYTNVKGVDYALPFDLGVQILFYRRDLFENPICKRSYYETYKQELKVPTDFVSYNQIASFFTKHINSNSPTNYGSTITLGNSGIITCEYLIRLLGISKNILDKNGMLDFENPNMQKAMEQYIETTKYSNSKINLWWKSAVEEFARGDVAMTIVFSNHASDIVRMCNSKVAGKVGFAAIPGGNPILGGGVLCLSKNTKKIDNAFEFMKWACSEEISSMFTLLGGVSPCKSIYNNMEILQFYPWLETAKLFFKDGFSRSSLSSVGFPIEQRKFEHILGLAVKNAAIGIMTSQESLKYAKENLQKIYE